jgi:hypothetical protein
MCIKQQTCDNIISTSVTYPLSHGCSWCCQFDRGSRVLKLTAKRFAGRSDSGEVKALGEDRSISVLFVGCKGSVVGRL